jgi:hypothetical protein
VGGGPRASGADVLKVGKDVRQESPAREDHRSPLPQSLAIHGRDLPHLLEIGANDLLWDAGPPVEIEGGKLLRLIFAAVLKLQVNDLRLGRQVDEVEPVAAVVDL